MRIILRRAGSIPMLLAALAVAVAGVFSLHTRSVQAQERVEVLHWWTSGGEAEALGVLKNQLEKRNISWADMPIAGGAGNEAMTVLRARVTAGDPPTSVQMLGFDIKDWAELDVLGDLNAVAARENWQSVIPQAIQDFSRYNGKWIAAPVNVHSTNWLWINKAALDKAGGKAPTSWRELVSLLRSFKEQGITPLAHGGQPWQDATLFENVVLSLGFDFYKAAIIDLNTTVLGSSRMKEAFDRMNVLREYVDDNFSGRDWNLASAMVINGEAGLQVMGDWAKGEFLRAGLTPGKEFVCTRYPDTQGEVTFNADQFVMFNVDQSKVSSQLAMASEVMSPSFQSAFNVVKGSVPARTDVSDVAFDACGKKAMADLREADKNKTLVGSLAHGYAQPSSVKNAITDVVTRHFNKEIFSEEAVTELVEAVELAL